MEDNFVLFMQNQNLSINTCSSYLSDIQLFKRYYNDSYGEKLNILLHADLMMYRSYLLNNNISAQSINRKIAAIKMYNLFLIENKIQDSLIVTDKDYIKVQKSMIKKDIPSVQDINKLKHFTCKDEKNAKRDYCFICILVYGGVRESELVTIRIVDIHLEEKYINIIGKGNKFRQIMINNYMYDAIKDYLDERLTININSPYLFVGQKTKNNGGKPLNRNFCNRLLNKYKELCKIAKLYPHLLRSFFCSHALHDAGYTIDQVANQAGHSSLNTTKKYLVTDQEDLLSLANRL